MQTQSSKKLLVFSEGGNSILRFLALAFVSLQLSSKFNMFKAISISISTFEFIKLCIIPIISAILLNYFYYSMACGERYLCRVKLNSLFCYMGELTMISKIISTQIAVENKEFIRCDVFLSNYSETIRMYRPGSSSSSSSSRAYKK